MARVKTSEVAAAVGAWMKANAGAKSLQEICAGVGDIAKQAKIYYLCRDLVKQGIMKYEQKKGKIKLFELVGDVSTAVFKEKAEKPVAEEKAE
jgi:hypothetical protein